jgi:hypothetical protein
MINQEWIPQDELPAEATELILSAEIEVQTLQRQRQEQLHTLDEQEAQAAARVRERLELELDSIRDQFNQQRQETSIGFTRQLTPFLSNLITQLKLLQEGYTKAGKLDEALAIRSRIRQFRERFLDIRSDPGTLINDRTILPGQIHLVEIVGNLEGPVWGTGIYTADSRLSAVAVHSGLVHLGERAVIRIRVLDGTGQRYVGSARNGVESLDFDSYALAMQLERL